MIFIAVLLVVFVVVLALGIAFVNHLYKTPQIRHRSDPGDLDLAFEELSIPTANDKNLYGWWVPAPSSHDGGAPTVILVHGWRRNVERVLSLIEFLHPAGFNLLAFDARSHGSSDADGISNMLKFSSDIRAAVGVALLRPEVSGGSVAVLGLSVGGAAAIHAASYDDRIGAVVTVGAFAHPGEVMRRELAGRGLPHIVISGILHYFEFQVGARLDDVAPRSRISKITAPVLLIHGDADEIITIEQGRSLYEAAGDSVEMWILPGYGHSDCSSHPEFAERVIHSLGTISITGTRRSRVDEPPCSRPEPSAAIRNP